ncbi:MAG: cytochrome c biogenesis protein CcdA [Erysipelotrichaceae bacterium]
MNHVDLNYYLVFVEGLLSFLAPCILPILPLYIGYLSGNAKQKDQDGKIIYQQNKVFLNTLFFVLGIASTFFLLGFSFTTFASYIKGNSLWLARIGGAFILIFGLIQLDVFKPSFMKKEYHLKHHLPLEKMNYFIAFAIGFFFSFSWTPCVGPMFSSVLIMAGNSDSIWIGILLVSLYTLGFVLPFLLLGIFTTSVLNLLKKYQKILSMSIKIGGVLLILIGGKMIFDTIQFNEPTTQKSEIKAPQITWSGIDNQEYRVSDYVGKRVMVFFWAEWCGYCKKELPIIQELYQEYGLNKKDVAIISVVKPEDNYSKEDYIAFMKENMYDFPIYFDDGSGFSAYQISSFPTTFMIKENGEVLGYVSGALPKENIVDLINKTKK